MEYVINWENEGNEVIDYAKHLYKTASRSIKQVKNYFKPGITWSLISSEKISARYNPKGSVYGDAGPFILLDENLFLLGLLNTDFANYVLKILNPTLNFSSGVVSRIPIDIDKNKIDNDIITNSVELSEKDWDSHETSWDFKQSPLLNVATSIENAVQIWQEKVTKDFFQLHSNEEELNRIFIDIYGLQDELTPEVALKDITILQKELKSKDLEALEPIFREKGATAIQLPINKAEVISQFISYAIGIYMGRYRLDKPGLNIAHPNPTAEELASYTVSSSAQRIENTRHPELVSGSHDETATIQIDPDAIIPLMGKNCNFPDDAVHLVNELLDAIWGAETRIVNNNFIQECLNKDLDKFLVKDFYKYHCGMYKKKPIYWLFSSKKGAFQALVYMHRMNEFTVEKLRANYLLEHLKQLRNEKDDLEANTSNLSTQEAKRLDQIRNEIAECEDYDMDLKTIADAQITIDLDDGVTANYKLFETVLAKIK
jgi:hypothetical protein